MSKPNRNDRNIAAHLNRKSRRLGAKARRAGMSPVQPKAPTVRPLVVHHDGWSETNESNTYQPLFV
jgi:hypothetical protein